MLLGFDDIKLIHKKYAPSQAAFDLVFTHCQVVWEIAEELINKSHLTVDIELTKVGCLLHDIGVYHLFLPSGAIDNANYIKHGIEGYDILKQEGFDEQICRFASCHIGVGLTRQEIVEHNLPIPPADYQAETTEEQLVMYADTFHTKSNPPKFVTTDTYIKKLQQYGEEKVEKLKHFQQKFGTPNLGELSAKYGFEII